MIKKLETVKKYCYTKDSVMKQEEYVPCEEDILNKINEVIDTVNKLQEDVSKLVENTRKINSKEYTVKENKPNTSSKETYGGNDSMPFSFVWDNTMNETKKESTRKDKKESSSTVIKDVHKRDEIDEALDVLFKMMGYK